MIDLISESDVVQPLDSLDDKLKETYGSKENIQMRNEE
jgi:hypothetical protein